MYLEAGVDRVPALVDHRAGDQILQRQILEQLADHLRRQIVDAGAGLLVAGLLGWWAHLAAMMLSICKRALERVEWSSREIEFGGSSGEIVGFYTIGLQLNQNRVESRANAE